MTYETTMMQVSVEMCSVGISFGRSKLCANQVVTSC